MIQPNARYPRPGLKARLIYYSALLLYCVSIAIYFGPNRILYSRWTRPDIQPLIAETQLRFVPTIQMLKNYQRSHNHLPVLGRDQDFPFRGDSPFSVDPYAAIAYFYPGNNIEIQYNLNGPDEHFEVILPILNNRLDLPAVILPTSQPTSQP